MSRRMAKAGNSCFDIVSCGRASADHDDVEKSEVNVDPETFPLLIDLAFSFCITYVPRRISLASGRSAACGQF